MTANVDLIHAHLPLFLQISTETGNRVEWSAEENYMFRLSIFREKLLEWLESDEQGELVLLSTL